MSKFIKISKLTDITPGELDGHKYRLSFQTGEVVGTEFRQENDWQIDVTVSGTLQAIWGKTDAQIFEPTGSLAVSKVIDLASKGLLASVQSFDFNTYTAPQTPPNFPVPNPGSIFAIPETMAKSPVKQSDSQISFLSDDISELRDQINTISKNFMGDRLLELPQERAIVDLYKPVDSVEKFRNRIQSLGGMAIAINNPLVGKILGKASVIDIGSLNLLEELLTKYSDAGQAKSICDVFKRINDLRQGYPTHGDNVDKVIEAHDFFKFPYPVEDYVNAWERVLSRYFDAMKKVLNILKREREKNATINS